MKKNFFTTALISCMILFGCHSGDDHSSTVTADTLSVDSLTQSMPVENKDTNKIEDPDPSDSIPASAYASNTYGKETEEMIRAKLQDMYKDDLAKNIVPDFSRKFIFFQYDLNDDGQNEIFVGTIGPYFCGSGGCTVLLLSSKGDVITEFSVTDYPVIIANSKTKGWKDLILYSGRKNHLVKYSGKAYPSNPSVQPVFKETPGDDLPRALNFVNEPYAWFKF